MLVLRVEEIKKKPRDIVFTEDATLFPVLHEAAQSGECLFLTPVAGNLQAVWEYDHARVSGNAHTRIRLGCARCLAEFELDLKVSFVVYYSEATPGFDVDDEIELAEQDLLSASYTGDEIHVMKEVGEQLLAELPIKPLCDERCRGLCSVCGVDMNREMCSCEQQNGSLAFSALKQFTVPRKGE